MIKKGIILAGGMGTRMRPLTKAVNKQLLPLYDKPLIFYPLSILMLSGIRDVLIIVNKGQLGQFKKVLPEKNNLGIKIKYAEQKKPNGLPEAFIIGEKFIGKDNVSLILGDNFFYGQSLGKVLKNSIKLQKGAKIFLHPVKKPNLYGVATINNQNKVIKLEEKPKKTVSNLAVTGLYFFDNKVINYAKKLKPSKRKELEIIDLLKIYKKKRSLLAEFIGRGGTWLDAGSIKDLYSASNYVSTIEDRQGLKIGCPEEIAYNNKWISKNELKQSIIEYGNCEYAQYLKRLI
ncbi:glucose-1-phosphate thymidylyltransferase RfbA [Pelagibacteraceae bacterium]|nr:glucose-1-phosphate thymidylyltransferase RfbA [Pelagibacteraceae bacterium]MDC0511848.1 glucose-1-phosphate thymidylyltransferase RfbA [Pelagibacteraceae bacterium]